LSPGAFSKVSLEEPLFMQSQLQSLEMLSEGLIDDLGDGQVVEVRLPANGLDPSLFDVEGGALNVFQVQKNARLVNRTRLIRSCAGE
jgi:hypothetical protein